jgi:chromosome segregation ATPase
MSLLIHQLHTELDKAHGDSDALQKKVHSLESAVADFVDRETTASSQMILLQDMVQSKSDELLDMKRAHDILQQELNSTRLQVQTYTTEKEAYQDRNQRTQDQLSVLHNLVEQKDTELETLGMTVDKLNDQLCQECLRYKEACDHIVSLEKSIQNLRQCQTWTTDKEAYYQDRDKRTQEQFSVLQNLIEQKDTELETLGMTLNKLNNQICQECLRNKEECNHIDSLKHTIQYLRHSIQEREEQEQKILSRVLTLEEMIQIKDAEVHSLKATLSTLSLQKEEHDARNQKKERDKKIKFIKES